MADEILRIEPGKRPQFWIAFWDQSAGVQVHLPAEFSTTGKFSLFWRAYAGLGALDAFVNSCTSPDKHIAGTLFQYDRYDLEFPPHRSDSPFSLIPTPVQDAALKSYGSPRFARYDVYDQQTRIAREKDAAFLVWAALADSDELDNYMHQWPEDQPQRKEMGLYTTVSDMRKLNMKAPLIKVVSSTIVPKLLSQRADSIIETLLEFIEARSPSGLAENPTNFGP